MTKHGGKRHGAGRPAGAKSRATVERRATLTELAQEHTEAAVMTLAEVMMDAGAPHSARIAASNALLDRGYGRPAQAVDHTSSDGTMSPAPITGFEVSIARAPQSNAD